MNLHHKILIEKAADIGNNIRIYVLSTVTYKILQAQSSLGAFFNKKPCLIILITDGLLEMIAMHDGKKTVLKTSHDLSICESLIINMESELNSA